MPNNLQFLVYSRLTKSETILKSNKRISDLSEEWSNETADKIHEEQRENILRVKTKRMKKEEYKLGTEAN